MLARQIAIGFGVAVIFPLLVYYGVASFYPSPKTTDYFQAQQTPPAPSATAEERKDYAERQKKERDAYNSAARDFSRILVLVATPIGVAAILIGAFLSINAVGTGLIVGGIASVAFGYFGYWQYLDDWVRFVSLLAGFAILLFVGYRRFGSRPVASGS